MKELDIEKNNIFRHMGNMLSIFGDLILETSIYSEFIFNDIENSLNIKLTYNNHGKEQRIYN